MGEPQEPTRFYAWRPRLRLSWFRGIVAATAGIVLWVFLAALTESVLAGTFLCALLAGGLALLVRAVQYADAPLTGFRTSPDGLTRVDASGESETVSWDAIEGVDLGQPAVVQVPDGHWTVPEGVQDATALLGEITHQLESLGKVHGPKQAIPAEQVAEWLGIRAEESLVCRPRTRWARLLAFPLVMAATVLAVRAEPRLVTGPGFSTLMLIALFALPHSISELVQFFQGRRRGVVAGTWGLRYREGRRWVTVDWADLLFLQRVPRENRQAMYYATREQVEADEEWRVLATGAEFRFHPSHAHAERLVNAIRRALEARESGQLLPRMTDVPATAISRASVDVTPDRGVSRAGAAE